MPTMNFETGTVISSTWLNEVDEATFNKQAADVDYTPAGNITANTVQAALTELDADLTSTNNAKADIASPTFTGTVTIPSPFTIDATSVTTSGAELNFVDGVTSAIQTQLDNITTSITNLVTTGTWSPVLVFVNSGTSSATYSAGTYGKYTKIGSRIIFEATIIVATITYGATNGVYFSLPFVSAVASTSSLVQVQIELGNGTSPASPYGIIDSFNSNILLMNDNAVLTAATGMNESQIKATTIIRVSGAYEV